MDRYFFIMIDGRAINLFDTLLFPFSRILPLRNVNNMFPIQIYVNSSFPRQKHLPATLFVH
ncbi:hypothetical protein PGRAN_08334 [Listeria grandensis FSL F6-0971]|uniref:Uncharacterized protein n=1 Tax=Listeria grandensis FSL F6-0971 TaxID=1265819 RepID=W7BSZ6_9LIST|nr:hypothetical protein PGRAN_08334 [Listeria grandensis FSL F6-0971]